MDSVLNAAFIGCGAIAQKKHLPLSCSDPSIHIKALFDANRDTAWCCKEEFGGEDTQIADDAEEIFSCDDIDLVFIATPNNTHALYSIKALNSRKHVICEKPMALNAADAEAMLEASVRNNRMLHISYQNRFTNQAQYVKRLFDEGFFSDIYYAKALALRRRAVPTWGVTTSKAFQGGGPLTDIGSHALDLAMWLSDNFEPDYAVGTAYDKIARRGSEANLWGNWDTDNYDVEDCALGFVVMKNGMTLTVDAAYALNVAEEYEASVDLFGVTGGVRLREQNGVTLIHEVGGRMCVTKNELQESFRSLTPNDRMLSASAREHASFMKLLLDGQSADPAAK
ncbi:MAG TPA: Gfo/Idh/MocA family oxidoreductase [Feifaniaceae bacterium]|nr:Gfo/Idh/MocA family oxidoreductase [Feifaniaceae bacterium]